MFGRIVVGTDGSDTAGEAVRQATELAKLSGARLDIVSAFEPIPQQRIRQEAREAPGDVQYEISPREDVNLILDNASGVAKKEGVEELQTHAREGDPADAILDVAEEIKADLIVVGNKGMTGARRFLLGSVPNKVSHHAPCSVIIVRTTG
jgi:nucleotide-binding universal stress UspA family protein